MNLRYDSLDRSQVCLDKRDLIINRCSKQISYRYGVDFPIFIEPNKMNSVHFFVHKITFVTYVTYQTFQKFKYIKIFIWIFFENKYQNINSEVCF